MPEPDIDIYDIQEVIHDLEHLIAKTEATLHQTDYHGKLRLVLDVVFLRVFNADHDHRLLIGLLNGLLELPEGERILRVERLDSRMFASRAGDKNPILDLLVRDQLRRLIQIELQLVSYPAYMNRAVFYLTRVHSEQLKGGEGYEQLNRSIGVHILSWTLLKPAQDWPGPITRARFCDLEHKREVTDQLELVFVELPKFRKPSQFLETEREKWLYYLKNADRMTQEDVKMLNLKILDEVDEKLLHVSRNEEMRFAFLGETKAYLDALSYRTGWQNHYLKEGIAQGTAQGIAQGIVQGQREALRELLSSLFGPLPPSTQHKLEQLTDLSELKRLTREAVRAPNLQALQLD
ncbi:MAG: Rpn family recombination-promoting nuclease/putative transposase [Myxococcota bacterium]